MIRWSDEQEDIDKYKSDLQCILYLSKYKQEEERTARRIHIRLKGNMLSETLGSLQQHGDGTWWIA